MRHGLAFHVNVAAFKRENVNDVLQTPVADPNPIAACANIRLDGVLRMLLARIPVPSGAVFMIWPNEIEITTFQYLRFKQFLLPEPPPPPTLAQIQQAFAMRDTLLRPSQFPGFGGPKTSLEEALAVMTRRYGLCFRINEHAFRFENVNDVLKTETGDIKLTARSRWPGLAWKGSRGTASASSGGVQGSVSHTALWASRDNHGTVRTRGTAPDHP